MRKTLLLIPHEFASIPVFGVGWILGFMVFAAIVVTAVLAMRKQSPLAYWKTNGFVWAIAAAVIVFVMPNVELSSPTGQPVGMAIRGYGVMLLLGVIASVALALARGRRYGISDETMLGIAPWLLVGGIVGARAFYVIEYWDRFFTGELISTARNLIDFTGGGLVVYGAFIGGFLAGVAYVLRHGLPFLTMGDVIVPCLFIGLSLGRLGCLMNGCCYGNACEDDWASLRFPNGSPVFQDQLDSGELLGIRLDRSRSTVEAVEPGSIAAASGIRPGDKISKLDSVRSIEEADPARPMEDAPLGLVAVVNGKDFYWPASRFPERANPVRASQVISSVGGLVLCLALCLFSHFVHRPGMVMLVGFASYAVLRFGMEMLRNDEPGQFGTALTISQWVSVVVFILSCGGLLWLRMQQWSATSDRRPPSPESPQAGPVGG
ncbi:MAG: prolipoprotein diacylglyceryl transferase family protein [Planctomycetaceae bacterium]